MSPQPPSTLPVPDPLRARRADAREFLSRLAQAEPVKAWGLGLEYRTAEDLENVTALLGVLVILLLVNLGLLGLILGRV